MREFLYYSTKARTSGNFDLQNLMKAGRMDIVCNVIIAVFFLSHKLRENVKLHLVFHGMPCPPRHLILESDPEIPISKKDVSGLIIRGNVFYCDSDNYGEGIYINPNSGTGKIITIPAHYTVKFIPSKKLQKRMNN